MPQDDLFLAPATLPEGLPSGFRYQPEFLTAHEEQTLAAWIATLALKPYEFRGYQGLRRVLAFGSRYDQGNSKVEQISGFPGPLLALRERAARWAGHQADDIRMMLVSEYKSGAPIGWHRDRPQFKDVIGVSLLAPASFRLRRAKDGSG